VSCAIADGILPGNEGRNYVIRRILRRGIMYGQKNLGLKTGDFSALVAPVIESLGDVFPELKTQRVMVEKAIRAEEESFGRTLTKGLAKFEEYLLPSEILKGMESDTRKVFKGVYAFELYDTYGFPLDMTQVLATEQGLDVDVEEFDAEMEKQRERGRAARKTDVIVASTEGDTVAEATKFVGYSLDATHATHAKLVDVVKTEKDTYLVFDQTPFYGEMGGQVGDAGHALINGVKFDIVDTIKDKSGRHLHKIGGPVSAPAVGASATLQVDFSRRRAINRHHSAAHLIHWALRKILGTHVRQFGTHKTPDRMRFDFTHFEQLTHAQLKECEQLINEKVIDNSPVSMTEIDYDKKPEGRPRLLRRQIRQARPPRRHRRLLQGTLRRHARHHHGRDRRHQDRRRDGHRRRHPPHRGRRRPGRVRIHRPRGSRPQGRQRPPRRWRPRRPAKARVRPRHQKELEKKLKAFEAKASAGLAEELAAKGRRQGWSQMGLRDRHCRQHRRPPFPRQPGAAQGRRRRRRATRRAH
jgi:alanyl-tRNA synthetase